MNRYRVFFFLFGLALCSCGAKVSRNLLDDALSRPDRKVSKVVFIEQDEDLPDHLIYIGELKFGQKLFPKACTYKHIRERAIGEARNANANVVKIVHEQFNDSGEDCYRMSCNLYFDHSYTQSEKLDQSSLQYPREEEVIDLFASDSISVKRKYLINSLYLSRKGWVSTNETKNEVYEKLRVRALDSLAAYKGNVLKICSFNGGMRVELHSVDREEFDLLSDRISQIIEKHNRDMEHLEMSSKDFIYADLSPKPAESKFWYTIDRDSTVAHKFELGVYGGSDILAGFNLHINGEYHFVNTSYAKLALSSKSGIMLVAAGYGLGYVSPGIKLSVPIDKFWFTLVYGKEFIRFSNNVDRDRRTATIGKRLDFGLKMYKDENASVELYYPVRLEPDVIAWYTGGLVIGLNKRF